MNEMGVDSDGTLGWLTEHHGQVLSNFQTQYRLLPSWGPARRGTRDQGEQAGDVTVESEETRRDADDGSAQYLES